MTTSPSHRPAAPSGAWGIENYTFVPEAPGGFIAQYENNSHAVYIIIN
jgi:hypothetical protein